MTDLRLFENGEFEIQVIPDGDSFTVRAPGLANALGMRDAHNLVKSIPADEKGYFLVSTPGGDQHIWHLTEAGFYRAIGQRQAARIKDERIRAQVERFQGWVFGEVLPAIRRDGAYGSTVMPSHAEALRGWADTLERAEKSEAKVIELEPMAQQAALHRAADGLVSVGDFANKVKAWAMREHGVRVKHDEVWDFLGQIGLVIRGKTIRNNQPTAWAIERDFVRVKETTYETNTRGSHTSSSSRLTPAGEGWAWDRAVRRIVEHGSLAPTKSIERKAS